MKTFNDTKASLNPKSTDNYSKKEVTPAEEAVMFDNGPDKPDDRLANEAVKGSAWLLGIVGVFAICLLIAWAVDLHHSPFSSVSSRSIPRQTATISPSNYVVPNPTANAPHVVTILMPVSAPSIKTAAPAPSVQKNIKLIKANSPANLVSKSDQARIEREALEVIHGDFGNNPGRKEKLGADYAAVQAKVNELLHI